jgi:hypothetical protein
MTENLYKPKKKTDATNKATKQDATPAITSATNAAGEVFNVGDLLQTGDYLIPRQGTIDRFWQDDQNTLWVYYLPVESQPKQWQSGVAKLDSLEKVSDTATETSE